MEKWQVIATGDLKKRLEQKTAEIAEALLRPVEEKENLGLMGGKPGAALFLAYYSFYSGEERFTDRAFLAMSETFDGVNSGFQYHTFAGGLAGIGWTVEHLVQKGLLNADTDEILSELDPYLQAMMIRDMQQGSFDYLHGALGIVLYLLKRKEGDSMRMPLENLVAELEKHAEQDAHGLKWLSVLDHEKGNKGYNLSLSHGLASIICILAKMRQAGIAPAKVPTLLEGAVGFLLGSALDTSKYKVNFPSWINPPEQSYYSRLGWCYGDLGSGSTLWRAARLTGNKEWEKKGIDTLLHATQRKDLKENNVLDAGLCHGAAGIAHIFNRFFQETGIGVFKETALYWFDKTLDFAAYPDGIAGYKAWHTEKYGGWVAETGFLEGAAGIGLAILSAVSEIAPDWDESLLLS